MSGLHCGMRGLHCGTRDLIFLLLWRMRCSWQHVGFSLVVAWAPEPVGSVVVARGLSCPKTGGIFVPWRGIEPESPALTGGFFTTGPPGKTLDFISWWQELLSHIAKGRGPDGPLGPSFIQFTTCTNSETFSTQPYWSLESSFLSKKDYKKDLPVIDRK